MEPLNSFDAAKIGEWIGKIERRSFQVIVDHLCKIVEISARWWTDDADVVLECFNSFPIQVVFE